MKKLFAAVVFLLVPFSAVAKHVQSGLSPFQVCNAATAEVQETLPKLAPGDSGALLTNVSCVLDGAGRVVLRYRYVVPPAVSVNQQATRALAIKQECSDVNGFVVKDRWSIIGLYYTNGTELFNFWITPADCGF